MKLVKYSAAWCGPCKAFAPVAEKVAAEVGLSLEEVDVDETPTEGVTAVPTTRLVEEDGTVVAQKSGAMSPALFKTWLKANGAL